MPFATAFVRANNNCVARPFRVQLINSGIRVTLSKFQAVIAVYNALAMLSARMIWNIAWFSRFR